MAKRRKPIMLREHARLQPPEPGQALVTVSAGPADEAIALWSPPHGVRARVVAYAPKPLLDVTIDDLRLSGCHVQPLPSEHVLLVAARRPTPDGTQDNAIVVDAAGNVERTGTLGDGIEHVQTTPSGKIWVGYFDEGIYGGSGLGAPGVVRFSGRLRPEWRFPRTTFPGVIAPIEDCYALNVSGETVWSSYYSEFPVVRIQQDKVTSWPGTGSAVQALIVDGTRCALLGGYATDRDRLLAGDLTRGHFRAYQLTLPGHRRLPGNAVAVGRGPHLHVFADAVWYRLDLDDLT
jgi:hypothetical protein